MKKVFFLFALTALLSCNSNRVEDSNEIQAEVPVKIIPAHGDGGEASLFITGMSCEKMCVSKIKKTLADLDGVESMEVDFVVDREVDQFTVQFDEAKVSEKEMIEAVQGIAGGVYTVTEVEVKKDQATSYKYRTRKSKEQRPTYKSEKMADHSFKMPNIFEVLKRFGGLN